MAQSQGHRPVTPVSGTHVLQGAAVRRWIALAEIVADQTRDLVDVLNVFPVPDADTGTTVLLSGKGGLHRGRKQLSNPRLYVLDELDEDEREAKAHAKTMRARYARARSASPSAPRSADKDTQFDE